MNPGGDAAEQVVRLSLEGFEVTARLSGRRRKTLPCCLPACSRNRLRQEVKQD